MPLLRPPAPHASPSPTRVAAIAAMAVATLFLGLGLVDPSAAQEARSITMTTPLPERGYWLPEDPAISFAVDCPGESRTVEGDSFSDHGWWGSDGFGLGVSRHAAEGVYDVVVSCLGGGEVRHTETFPIEVGAITSLQATVGTVAGECATTTEITVEPGTEVYWCFTLVPHPELGDLALFDSWDSAEHTVADTINGALGTATSPVDEPLGAGLTTVQLGIVSSSVVDATVINTGTWSTLLTELDEDDTGEPVIDEQAEMPVRTASARVVVLDTEGTAEAAAPTAPAAPVMARPAYTG